MIDSLGRTIDYLRISITDRCNLRCCYCMPCEVQSVSHEEILRYEEILTICRQAILLGITRFKVTGGEPFVRKGVISFIQDLCRLDGVEDVTITTNGLLLRDAVPALQDLPLGAVTVSLDTVDAVQFQEICRVDGLARVKEGFEAAIQAGIRTKINALLLAQTKSQCLTLAALAESYPMDVRFIEVMPIGYGKRQQGYSAAEALQLLRQQYPDLAPTDERRGNGPARYYRSKRLQGCIGFIAATSHTFCHACNRLRLTSTGILKPCLCYDTGIDIKKIVRSHSEAMMSELQDAIINAVKQKPVGHCFDRAKEITEGKTMNQIGG